jgi:hypothetical protein
VKHHYKTVDAFTEYVFVPEKKKERERKIERERERRMGKIYLFFGNALQSI